MTPEDERPYRPCVGVMLLDGQGRAFAGWRKGMRRAAWQMPQGGIDKGEAPRAAALRELAEETGVNAVDILGESNGWHHYDLPRAVSDKAWRGRYRGQKQKWFAMRFLGQDSDVDLETHHPEFEDWRWIEPERLPELVIPFKRAVYEAVLEEFRPLIEGLRA
jgi:putative (di)nucleoside polyphosphate hydrolase